MEYTDEYHSPLGVIFLTANDEALTGLWFRGQRYAPDSVDLTPTPEAPILCEAKRWLDIYFKGKVPAFTPPLAPNGTPFRKEVWELLAEIPYGTTVTYGELAARLAARRGIPRMSAQAVGGAVAHNRISLILPCHRVLGAGEHLVGYAGGIKRKAALLRLENARRR